MASAKNSRPTATKGNADRGAFLEIEPFDDEWLSDEFDDVDDSDIVKIAAPARIPLWRLIEMSNENRLLKREMADFEDYFDIEDTADHHGMYSH